MASLDEFAREKEILALLKSDGHVSVSALSLQFAVSTVTIRKDLESLERRHLLRRVRGGAVSVSASDEGAFEMRLRHSENSKMAIARAAASLVHNGDVIALDSSTTSYYLAQEILGRRDLVVVTNGLRHALLLMEDSSARVLMPGGIVRRSAGSLVGPIGDVLAGRGRIGKGFFGVVGVSTTLGLMDISAEEAQTKRFLVDACDSVYGLFDSSKLTGFGLHSFAAPSVLTGVVTDEAVSAEAVAAWDAVGVAVTVAPANDADGAATGLSAARSGRSSRPLALARHSTQTAEDPIK